MKNRILIAVLIFSSVACNQFPKKTRQEVQAQFKGGRGAMVAFLQKHIKVPPIAEELGVNGRVYLKFVVSETGKVSNVRVVKGVPDCPECDEEAKRVIRQMPDWIPGTFNGKPIKQWYTLPIRFNVY